MFFKEGKDLTKFADNVFSVNAAAKSDKDESKVNATVGSLFDENGQLVALKSVYKCFDKVSDIDKAAYAKSSLGNPEFREAIKKFVLEGKANGEVCTTAGGTGAIALALDLCRDKGQSVIIPDVAWGNYKQMLNERDIKAVCYDPYSISDLISKIEEEEKPFVLINSPCENPCGLSYDLESWKKILSVLNKKESILLNDIAYIDYAYDPNAKEYMKLFNELGKNVLVLIASSCSKTFSYYGMRLGSLIAINSDKEFLDLFMNQCERHIRTTYSNCNNAAMIAIADILNNHFDEFIKEKEIYRNLLKERSSIFVKEAKEVGLELYPYDEGFFVTIKCDNNEKRDVAFNKLLDNHIYSVKLNKGIRVAICSIPLSKIKGLAKRIKEII